jgi:inhibitor of KinA
MPFSMPVQPPYQIYPIGDSAIVLDFGNVIDEGINDYVLALFHELSNDPFPGLREIAPAYSSLAIYYDLFEMRHFLSPAQSPFKWIAGELERKLGSFEWSNKISRRSLQIPVCYAPEFAPDLELLAGEKKISAAEVVAIHSAAKYRVFMLGFLPGFAYMGKVDERISMPRRPEPRQKVQPGSLGIAGRQTGIYPLECPGGWQIIGRTPVKLFDPASIHGDFFLFHPGDEITFYSISKDEFESY